MSPCASYRDSNDKYEVISMRSTAKDQHEYLYDKRLVNQKEMSGEKKIRLNSFHLIPLMIIFIDNIYI